MPSQADYMKVYDLVLEPLERHYNKKFDSKTIDDFTKDLCGFDEKTLIDAMAEVRQNEVRRPNIAHIVQACKKFTPGAGAQSHEAEKKRIEARNIREARIRTRAKDYVDEFRHTNSERLAAIPPFNAERLILCVYEAARLQAQWLEGERNCGFLSSSWLPAAGSTQGVNKKATDERVEWWLDMCRRGAKTGQISVEIPWKWYEIVEAQLEDNTI